MDFPQHPVQYQGVSLFLPLAFLAQPGLDITPRNGVKAANSGFFLSDSPNSGIPFCEI